MPNAFTQDHNHSPSSTAYLIANIIECESKCTKSFGCKEAACSRHGHKKTWGEQKQQRARAFIIRRGIRIKSSSSTQEDKEEDKEEENDEVEVNKKLVQRSDGSNSGLVRRNGKSGDASKGRRSLSN
ncbi:hypothetical protein O6H91_04G015400 [Diphasiastrum complanatum]|uniref:Uncharacterized protein n=1 Tax=Diphasiastrum complanatum TaxID=34168 RepID=A0ACC2DUF2_DIPCM|nr:hypothetical protein O6H91_Y356900 [Diphasiastrum complanatum]KAJ7557911.1 hypothetical protein O6H91_04G015400 [Diphasiastrum complanatum]